MVHCGVILFCSKLTSILCYFSNGLMDACFRSLLVFVMASSPSCLPVPVAITKNYAECHFWFLELTEAMAQNFKLLWQCRLAYFPPILLYLNFFLFLKSYTHDQITCSEDCRITEWQIIECM